MIQGMGFQQFFDVIIHWVFLLLFDMSQTKTMPES